ncbi:MAG: redoxin domain-containing protein [Anaerolineales bacterium]|nr:redoxin domain-containing protein [Anaerolineales bacterium]
MTPAQRYAGKVNAPEFPAGMDWINVDAPLTLRALRGKVVLLDFWTYGCINCIHIIPDLKRLEAEFPSELVVIGVHSAKFENEGQTENIRRIVQRYGVEHPVVNDHEFVIWQTYAVRAWPTSMLIDPRGKVLGYYSGEGVYDALQPVIADMIAEFDALGEINRTALPLNPETEKRAATALAFPGKVLADPLGNRLFIADSNNNRLIVAALDTYAVQAVIGGRAEGFTDGDYATARFDYPHGMALDGTILYVADTGNHALRAVDLAAGAVTTIAGTGTQANTFESRLRGGAALETPLNSPWDVVFYGGKLYIAMAGHHQLWVMDIAAGEVQPFVGSGQEGLVDGVHRESLLAQPSGITTDGTYLYFADSEASAIRRAALDPAVGGVTTLVGTGLFDFGDVDGVGDAVRLQHALGVVYAEDGKLYVADTYNSKIKVIDPTTRESLTFAGSEAGFQDGQTGADARFDEPGGISYAAGKLYVADTNNSLIRIIDLTTRQTTTLTFPDETALLKDASAAGGAGTSSPGEFFGEVFRLDPVTAAPGAGTVVVNITLPEGYKMNGQAPFRMVVYTNTPIVSVAPTENNRMILAPEEPVTMPVTFQEGSAEVTVDADVFYCEAVNESLCFPASYRFVVPLTVTVGGAPTVTVNHKVIPPVLPEGSLGGN